MNHRYAWIGANSSPSGSSGGEISANPARCSTSAFRSATMVIVAENPCAMTTAGPRAG